MNIVTIAGRLGRDPETRFTQSGQKVTSFTVATNSRRGGKDETIWWRITIWGDRFDKMLTYLKKGSAVIVCGEMHISEYTDREGNKRTSLEITADSIRFSPFGRPADGTADNAEGGQQQSGYGGASQQAASQDSASPFTAGTGAEAQDEEEPMPF